MAPPDRRLPHKAFRRDESQKAEKRDVRMYDEFLQARGKWLGEHIAPDTERSFLALVSILSFV